MLYKKLLLASTFMLFVFSAGCEADSHEKHSEIQQSTLKGKSNMPTQSPMLNEIFASEKYIRPGQSKDVSHIVSKYLPIGSSKEEVINKLNEMNQNY